MASPRTSRLTLQKRPTSSLPALTSRQPSAPVESGGWMWRRFEARVSFCARWCENTRAPLFQMFSRRLLIVVWAARDACSLSNDLDGK